MTKRARFEIKEQAEGGQFYWRFVAANGEVMDNGEAYTRRQDVHRAVDRFRILVANAEVVDVPTSTG